MGTGLSPKPKGLDPFIVVGRTWCNNFSLIFLLFSFICVCMQTICMQYLLRPEEGIRFHGTGVTGSCEPPDVGDENQTWILCKSSKCL